MLVSFLHYIVTNVTIFVPMFIFYKLFEFQLLISVIYYLKTSLFNFSSIYPLVSKMVSSIEYFPEFEIP